MIGDARPAWFDDAACRNVGPLVFFGVHGDDVHRRHRVDKAREICARCSVREACADFGRFEPFGVWGGTDEDDRALAGLIAIPDKPSRERLARAGLVPAPRVPAPLPVFPAWLHGTDRGFQWHRRRGEAACDRCRDAHAATQRARDAAAGRSNHRGQTS